MGRGGLRKSSEVDFSSKIRPVRVRLDLVLNLYEVGGGAGVRRQRKGVFTALGTK